MTPDPRPGSLHDTQAVPATPPHAADLQILRKVMGVPAGKIQPWNLELTIYQGPELGKYQYVELRRLELRTSCMPCLPIPSGCVALRRIPAGQDGGTVWLRRGESGAV